MFISIHFVYFLPTTVTLNSVVSKYSSLLVGPPSKPHTAIDFHFTAVCGSSIDRLLVVLLLEGTIYYFQKGKKKISAFQRCFISGWA